MSCLISSSRHEKDVGWCLPKTNGPSLHPLTYTLTSHKAYEAAAPCYSMFSTAVNKIILRHLFPAIKCLTICPVSCFTQTAISWQCLLTMTAALHKDRSYCQDSSPRYPFMLPAQQGREENSFSCCVLHSELFITFSMIEKQIGALWRQRTHLKVLGSITHQHCYLWQPHCKYLLL